jgi:hypothetical protein
VAKTNSTRVAGGFSRFSEIVVDFLPTCPHLSAGHNLTDPEPGADLNISRNSIEQFEFFNLL